MRDFKRSVGQLYYNLAQLSLRWWLGWCGMIIVKKYDFYLKKRQVDKCLNKKQIFYKMRLAWLGIRIINILLNILLIICENRRKKN